jgi:hypothetical protein
MQALNLSPESLKLLEQRSLEKATQRHAPSQQPTAPVINYNYHISPGNSYVPDNGMGTYTSPHFFGAHPGQEYQRFICAPSAGFPTGLERSSQFSFRQG